MNLTKYQCTMCGSKNVKRTDGFDERYPDVWALDCNDCGNWEEVGNNRPGTFNAYEDSKMFLHVKDEVDMYEVPGKEEVVDEIVKVYLDNNVCIGELMTEMELIGFSIVDVVEIYAKVMFRIERDKVSVHKDGEVFALWKW